MRLPTAALTALLAFALASPALAGKPKSPPTDAPLASRITYTLPAMSVTIAVDLTLIDCKAQPLIQPTATITPVIGSEAHPEYRFVLDAADLQSFSRDKNLALETYPNGTLKSINGGVTDQTAGIFTSLIKTAVTLAGVLGPQSHSSLAAVGACNAATQAALGNVASYKASIVELRKTLASKDPVAVRNAKDAIDVLAAEIARIQTTDLHLTLPPTTYPLNRSNAGAHIAVSGTSLAKWLQSPQGDAAIDELALGFCVLRQDAASNEPCSAALVDKGLTSLRDASTDPQTGQPTMVLPVETPNCEGGPKCAHTLVLREPVNATVFVIAEKDGYVTPKDKLAAGALLARQDLAISQWGDLSYIPIKAGFAKSFSFQLGLDASGHKVSQGWTYKARGAALAGAASSIVDASAGLYKTVDGKSLAASKAELDALTTQKNLNQMRFCKAVIDAGGFTCPTQ